MTACEVWPEPPICTECGMGKAPWGRSVSLETVAGYCCPERCPGNMKAPYPSSLFPGEKRCEFGYGPPCPCKQGDPE